jgi:hypothetical protein
MCGGGSVRVRGGDQDPAGRPGRPEAIDRRRVGDLVEHHQPGQIWPFQPVQEAVRGMVRALALVRSLAQIAQRLSVAGDHGVSSGGRDPENQMSFLDVVVLVGQGSGKACLAGATQAIKTPCRVPPGNEQGRRLRGEPGKAEASLLPCNVRSRHRGDLARQNRPLYQLRSHPLACPAGSSGVTPQAP